MKEADANGEGEERSSISFSSCVGRRTQSVHINHIPCTPREPRALPCTVHVSVNLTPPFDPHSHPLPTSSIDRASLELHSRGPLLQQREHSTQGTQHATKAPPAFPRAGAAPQQHGLVRGLTRGSLASTSIYYQRQCYRSSSTRDTVENTRDYRTTPLDIPTRRTPPRGRAREPRDTENKL